MSDFVRKYDPTRPVGLANHNPGTAATHILDALDVTGWNYARRYALFREKYPKIPILYSESASAFSTRGFYELPLPKGKNDFSPTAASRFVRLQFRPLVRHPRRRIRFDGARQVRRRRIRLDWLRLSR